MNVADWLCEQYSKLTSEQREHLECDIADWEEREAIIEESRDAEVAARKKSA